MSWRPIKDFSNLRFSPFLETFERGLSIFRKKNFDTINFFSPMAYFYKTFKIVYAWVNKAKFKRWHTPATGL
jgi:hypothetical protein